MFFRNKNVKETKVKHKAKRTTLRITFNDTSYQEWWIDDVEDNNPPRHWLRFYKWYFTNMRPEIMMDHKLGESLIRRCDIKSFRVDTSEIEI